MLGQRESFALARHAAPRYSFWCETGVVLVSERVKVHMAPAVGSENNARSTKSSSQERRWLRRYASFERGGSGRLPPAPPNHCSSPAHWWSWQADFCDGCHHEPAADLGSCSWSTGRYVPRGKGGGRARRAARLFPGIWRNPRE